MNIQTLDVIRMENAGDQGILSVWKLDGRLWGFGIEPLYTTDKKVKPRCIPKGTYWAVRGTFKKKPAWLLQGVPDFEGVFIHVGNWAKDTLGCLCPGLEAQHGAKRGVARSVVAVRAFDLATITADKLRVNIFNKW